MDVDSKLKLYLDRGCGCGSARWHELSQAISHQNYVKREVPASKKLWIFALTSVHVDIHY
jgi:hypothetical protein